MKAHSFHFLFGFFLSSLFLCHAQQTANVSVPAPYSVVQRAANSRVWERTTYELLPSGQVVPHKQHYTELAAGLCYQQNGEWLDSQERISVLPDGTACSTNGQHQVYFPADIYNGVITLVTPDRLQLQSQPVGLSYDDGTNTVLIAELTNSVGQLVNSNQIVYPNAFTDFKADLRYTYTKGGLEQDIILQEQPPRPEVFGLNPLTTRLQILTEFLDPPQPKITTEVLPEQAGTVLTDKTLDFGVMEMMPGHAFLLGSRAEDEKFMVAKDWVLASGRQFLVEEVPFKALDIKLAALRPSQTIFAGAGPGKMANAISRGLQLPSRRTTQIGATKQFVRKRSPLSTGLVLDYLMVSTGATNFTFQGDMTYYVSETFNLRGTNNIFEGGAIIKFPTNSGTIMIGPTAGIKSETSTYRPVILTAADDDSVGDQISGSTGTPTGYYGDSAYLQDGNPNSLSLTNFRFNYAQMCLTTVNAPSALTTLYDDQFLNSQYVTDSSGGTYQFRNALFANIQTNFLNSLPAKVDIQNSTFLNIDQIIGLHTPMGGVNFTNCIFCNINGLTNQAGIILKGNCNGFYNAPAFGTNIITAASYPFQSVGAGSVYLANGCGFQGVGATNIDRTLAAELKQKTTYPPIVYSNEVISTVMTFNPNAYRDTNAAPDLGYHYDPLDYIFGGCDLSTNVIFSAGTAVGWFPGFGAVSPVLPYGISLTNEATLSFAGSVTQQCVLASYDLVQEVCNTNWENPSFTFDSSILINGNSNAPVSLLSATFTKWDTYDDNGFLYDNFSGLDHGQGSFLNCEFYNGNIQPMGSTLYFTNCLIFRGFTIFNNANDPVNVSSFAFENCTFYQGYLYMGRKTGQGPSSWFVENTSFDRTLFEWEDNYNGTNYTAFDYNAYNTNNVVTTNVIFFYPNVTVTLEKIGLHDRFVTNFNWQTSWLGNFYVPANSKVINAGSTNANQVGLYYFTTQTNQIPETNSIVDIGYHFMITDTNGNPL